GAALLLPGPAPPRPCPVALHDALPIWFWSVGAAAGATWSVAAETWLELSAGPFIENVQVHNNADATSDGRFVGGMRGSLTLRRQDRKSTRLNSSHVKISYAVFCLKKKK